MRILRGTGFVMKLWAHRFAVFITTSSVAVIVLVLANTIFRPETKAFAVTPPDSCFAFDSATGTITDYGNDLTSTPRRVGSCPLDVDIPSTIGGVAVTTIGGQTTSAQHFGAFMEKNITSVTFPGTLTTIGNDAFEVNSLTTVTIPNSVTTIGAASFSDNSLTAVTLSTNITQIPDFAFANNQLPTIAIPAGVTHVGVSAFENNLIVSATLPSTITSIDVWAFNANRLASLTLPPLLTMVANDSFSNNNLTSLTIPDSVTSIGAGALRDNHLVDVTFGRGVTKLDYATSRQAFAFNSIKQVTVPDTLTEIDKTVFEGQNARGADADSWTDFQYSIFSNDPAIVQTVYDSIWYTQLYTASPSNPGGLTDQTATEEDVVAGDRNGNGTTTDSLGGYVVNPTVLHVTFQSTGGADLVPSATYTGVAGTAYLADYLVKNTPYSTATGGARTYTTSAYFRPGTGANYTAPVVTGYTVDHASKSMVLGASMNTLAFVYTPLPPTISGVQWTNNVPTATGTFEPSTVSKLEVIFNGTTYTLGSSPELSVQGNVWTLDLTKAAPPFTPGTYTVSVRMTLTSGEILSIQQNTQLAAAVTTIPAPTTPPAQTSEPAPTAALANTGTDFFALFFGASLLGGGGAFAFFHARNRRRVTFS